MITVFGSINLDLIGVAPTLMRPGETVLGTRLDIAPGGKGANQALAAARAGAKVKMLGAVGNDDFARQALALLDAGGVDLSDIKRCNRHTGVALIAVDAEGENMITVLPGANSKLEATAIEKGSLKEGDTLMLQLETPIAEVAAAAHLARRAGVRTLLNVAPFADIPEALLEDASILVVNAIELSGIMSLLNQDDLPPQESAAWLAGRYGNTVVATLGEHGAVAASPWGRFSVPAIDIDPVDTVGAGDTFVGYLAAGLEEGLALEDALTLAVTASGLACLKPGAQPAIPTRAEVEQRLAGQ